MSFYVMGMILVTLVLITINSWLVNKRFLRMEMDNNELLNNLTELDGKYEDLRKAHNAAAAVYQTVTDSHADSIELMYTRIISLEKCIIDGDNELFFESDFDPDGHKGSLN